MQADGTMARTDANSASEIVKKSKTGQLTSREPFENAGMHALHADGALMDASTSTGMEWSDAQHDADALNYSHVDALDWSYVDASRAMAPGQVDDTMRAGHRCAAPSG